MRAALHLLVTLAGGFGRSLSAIICMFYATGRETLLRRATAHVELDELAVEQKRVEVDTLRAKNMIEIVQKVEKIQDPQLREKVRAAILRSYILQPPDSASANRKAWNQDRL
jgi:hypothetical protein